MTESDLRKLISTLKSLRSMPVPPDPLRKDLYDAMRSLLPAIEEAQDTINRIAYTVTTHAARILPQVLVLRTTIQPLQLTIAKTGGDLQIFEILARSKSPMSTVELSQATNADQLLLSKTQQDLAKQF